MEGSLEINSLLRTSLNVTVITEVKVSFSGNE